MGWKGFLAGFLLVAVSLAIIARVPALRSFILPGQGA